MGQALYRKYRSKSLAELVGQEHITQTLARALQAGRINHAYLFTGPRGVGKTSVARILAHEINKLPYSDTSHLDIIEIDAASNRRIDDIRDLRDKVHITPISAAYKVYIIDEVHMLTQESFNALLKTLEEPPAHVVFILATTEAHKLPATIISRTQRFSFRPVEQSKVVEHLKSIAKQENIAITDEALALVAEYGEGSFRDSISLLDQLAASSDGEITAETVGQTLGLAPGKLVDQLVAAASAKDAANLTTHLAVLNQQGVAATALLSQLLRALTKQAASQPELYTLLDELLEVPKAYNPHLKLTTTLMRFALGSATNSHSVPAAPASPPSVPPKQPPRATVATSPAPTISLSKPVIKSSKKSTQPDTLQEAAHTATQLDTLSAEGWGQTLAAVKTYSPPLHGILCQAEPRFDSTAQVLTLAFRFALHARKMDDVKNKNVLAKIMQETLGGAPAIKCEADAAQQPAIAAHPAAEPRPAPTVPAAPAPVNSLPLSQTAQTVIDLMGGGEVVHA